MTTKLQNILDGAQKKVDDYLAENKYDCIKFSNSFLTHGQAIKFNIMIAKRSEGLIVFNQVLPVKFLMMQDEKEAVDFIFDSTMVTIKKIAKLDKEADEEEKIGIKFN